MKQALLVLDDWLFLPVAYLSIKEDPEVCKQMALAFVGKFLSSAVPEDLSWSEAGFTVCPQTDAPIHTE